MHKSIDNEDTLIAPLILITIVENAFKFGLASAQQVPRISISLEVVANQLYFEVVNSKVQKNILSKKSKKKGIGVTNIERQLALQYPEKHTLKTKETEEQFQVNLNITL